MGYVENLQAQVAQASDNRRKIQEYDAATQAKRENDLRREGADGLAAKLTEMQRYRQMQDNALQGAPEPMPTEGQQNFAPSQQQLADEAARQRLLKSGYTTPVYTQPSGLAQQGRQ